MHLDALSDSDNQMVVITPRPSWMSYLSGVLTIKSPAAVARTDYDIVRYGTHSYSNHLSISIEIKDPIYVDGFEGYYTVLSDASCNEYYDLLSTSSSSIRIKRIDNSINFQSSADWGLSEEYSENYVVKWFGYYYIPETGTYNIKYTTSNPLKFVSSRCSIDTGVLSDLKTDTISCSFQKGYQSVVIYYTKCNSNSILQLEIYYTSESDIIKPVRIKSEDLQYQYLDMYYDINKEIANNQLVVKPDGVTLQYSIDQRLPNGISFSSDTGIISGTPTELLPTLTTYKITATDSNNNKYYTSVKLSVRSSVVVAPSGFYLYDINNGLMLGSEPTIAYDENMYLQFRNKYGTVTRYAITSSIPNDIQVENSASRTVIKGTVSSGINELVYIIIII